MSRATMVDLPPDEEQVDSVDSEETEIQQIAEEAVAPEANVEQPQEPALPDKYQGKSLAEVAQMHQEAEKMLGRQSTEVGELRKVVDDYITNQTQQSAPQQSVEPEDDLDYFTDPQAAVNRAIENHPKIKEAEQFSTYHRQQASIAVIQQKHPDMQEIVDDEGFKEWIRESPVRSQLFVEANNNYNADVADELFTLWKSLKGSAQQVANVEKQARKQQIRAANTGNAQGSAEGSRKKVYRRADIIKLMKEDPDRYQALSEEILRAYSEGRVK